MSLHPEHTYVHLAPDGNAEELDGAGFWRLPPDQFAQYGKGWVISEYLYTHDWPNWEMHPEGDEFVYLLSGAVELLLEQGAEIVTTTLEGAGAVLVPHGVWHTAKVRQPSRVLHVTRGAGTQTRPA